MFDPNEVLDFWLDEIGEKGWYNPPEGLDETIRETFEPMWQAAMKGQFGLWLTYPSGVLAYAILTDQFPRNMFRDTAQAFASDRVALAAVKQAISRGWDMRIDPPGRQFFYLPLMHSENLCNQDHCVRLMKERLADSPENLLHARAHREVIRRFGRFPHRNEALGRKSTKAETLFLEGGGYGGVVEEMKSLA